MTHAIGGNASIVGNYRVHIFTGGYSTLEVDEGGVLEYLIVAGGGSGGADHGGGGGGGQVITGSATYSEGTLDVYVGAGGLLGSGRNVYGTNGENSYLGNIIAVGGGRGGQWNNLPGGTGSSGGGGASFDTGGFGGQPLVSGTTGHAGSNGSNAGAGGGGGASTPGQQSEGGNGIISDLTGVSLMYGSGGGGADRVDGVGGSGAGSGNQVSGTMSGLPNRGGGGGGNTSQLSGSFGGSGIVAVRYLFTETGRRQIQTTDIDLQCLPLAQYTDTKSAIESLTGTTFGSLACASDNPTAPFGVYTLGGWHWYSTGSIGGASLAFQGEGVPLGTPGTVNFVGSPVSVTVSGTVARVLITGSSGGVSDHNSLTGLQGGTGSQYYHLAYNEWGSLITGSLTRLHRHSAVDIVTGTMDTARLGSGTANSKTYLRGDQSYAKPYQFLPMGIYVHAQPMTISPSFPYIVTIDRSLTFVNVGATVFVDITNNGSNYWTIYLKTLAGTTIWTFNTSAITASTWTLIPVTISNANVTLSDKLAYIGAEKTGTPGSCYLSFPLMSVNET